ncbi:hypothetical protein AAH054_11360 [Parabacteroides merdae]|nr:MULTISPECIES: hypothetical protein [Parabacteroides]MCG4893545.1 hypothetical protein [Parabacteroides merdae]MCO7170167.1 hypothetical protein [Parabacteroides merdae]MDB8918903.1 hypothetical protein [Parabacteroides merdae]MDB8927148.1 hypothetical protein [Parabacteroides merdae]
MTVIALRKPFGWWFLWVGMWIRWVLSQALLLKHFIGMLRNISLNRFFDGYRMNLRMY